MYNDDRDSEALITKKKNTINANYLNKLGKFK